MSFRAIYDPNDVILVAQAATQTTVTSSANPSIAGQSVTFTATVTANDLGAGTPTGSVQFMIDGSDYGDPVTLGDGGTAIISDAALDASGSPHSVSAVYTNLDGNYAGGTGTLIGGQVVNPAMIVYVDASYAGDAPARRSPGSTGAPLLRCRCLRHDPGGRRCRRGRWHHRCRPWDIQ